jgi:hypothetical protein
MVIKKRKFDASSGSVKNVKIFHQKPLVARKNKNKVISLSHRVVHFASFKAKRPQNGLKYQERIL